MGTERVMKSRCGHLGFSSAYALIGVASMYHESKLDLCHQYTLTLLDRHMPGLRYYTLSTVLPRQNLTLCLDS